jgi:hypothetical protein
LRSGRPHRILPPPSKIVVVALSRPMGIVFEEDSTQQRVIVADFVPGSNAEQAMKVGEPFV